MNVLFVCNQGQHRSKTAEELFKDKFNTKSAGVFTNLTSDVLSWADLVVVMEDFQRSEIAKRFPEEYLKKKIVSLEVPDIYQYNQPELKEILKEKVKDLAISEVVV